MKKKPDPVFDLDEYVAQMTDVLAEKHRASPRPTVTLIEAKIKRASNDQAARDLRDRKARPGLSYEQ